MSDSVGRGEEGLPQSWPALVQAPSSSLRYESFHDRSAPWCHHQVVATTQGEVTTLGSNFMCPLGSNFNDTYGGLYGPHSYPVITALCVSSGTAHHRELVSTLAFSCNQCGEGKYLPFAGWSNGTAGTSNFSPCLDCPPGGNCSAGGVVVANPNHWGALGPSDGPTPSLYTFAGCAVGYCCDGSKDGQCDSPSACGGHRTGPMCARCLPGYYEGLGSPRCVPRGKCPTQLPWVWTVLAVLNVAWAALQLVFLSDLLPRFASTARPNGKAKLIIYFFQVWHGHMVPGRSVAVTSVDATEGPVRASIPTTIPASKSKRVGAWHDSVCHL
jgi:hypothetical protein